MEHRDDDMMIGHGSARIVWEADGHFASAWHEHFRMTYGVFRAVRCHQLKRAERSAANDLKKIVSGHERIPFTKIVLAQVDV
jgi:hypothetical protein